MNEKKKISGLQNFNIKMGLKDVTVDNYGRQENSLMMHQKSFSAIF